MLISDWSSDVCSSDLRMRPDRIVVGECRGGEALDMLQPMNTGHDGSMPTVHANIPRDALSRIETLTLMAGFDLPIRAIRGQRPEEHPSEPQAHMRHSYAAFCFTTKHEQATPPH